MIPAINDSRVQESPRPSLDTATYGRRTFQGLPSIAVTGNRIWVAFLGGKSMPAGELPGDYNIFVYSDDGGVTWSREFYQVPVHPVTDRVGDPRLWAAPDGKLWVFFFQANSPGGGTNDDQVGGWASVIADPLAAEPVFEQVGWIGDGIPQRPFLYNGQWLLPIDYMFMSPRRPQRAGQHLLRIDWTNRRFEWVTTLPRNPSTDYNEPALLQLKDGGVLLHQRTTRGLLQRTSPAGRWGWTAAAPFSGFPTVGTRSALGRSPGGRVYMVTNNSATTRENMTIAFSDDEGATWPHQYTVQAGQALSYPDTAIAPNGDILVVHDGGRWWGQVVFTRINEDSIVRRTPQVTQTIVNWARKF